MSSYTDKVKHVCIVDDNAYKLETIVETIRRILPDCTVYTGECRNDMLRYLHEHLAEIRKEPESYLVVTDMQMPIYHNGSIRISCGYEVLDYLESHRLTCPAIIASSDRIDDEEAKNYYEHYIGSVKHSVMVLPDKSYKDLLEKYYSAL